MVDFKNVIQVNSETASHTYVCDLGTGKWYGLIEIIDNQRLPDSVRKQILAFRKACAKLEE
jgi:hypothetical protein